MPTDPIGSLDYAPRKTPPQRSWLNRIATLLCLVCFAMLAIGIAIEATTNHLLFENYISTFAGYGIMLAVVASFSRPSRRGG